MSMGISNSNNIYPQFNFEYSTKSWRRKWVSLEEQCRKAAYSNQEGEAIMIQDHSNTATVVPDYIKNIKEIEINHSQHLQLIGYDRATIDYARKAIRSKLEKDGPLQSPFPFFLKICQVSHGKKAMLGASSGTNSEKQVSTREYKPYNQAEYLRKHYKWLEYVNSRTTDATARAGNISRLNYIASVIEKLEA